MRFTSDAKVLLAALRTVSQTIDRKDAIKSCVKIEARKGGGVDLFTSSGYSASCYTVPGIAKADSGVVMVNCESLMRCVGQCEGDLNVSLKNDNLILQSGKREYKMVVSADPAKLPFRDEFDSFDDYLLDLSILQAAIRISTPSIDQIRRSDCRGITLIPNGKRLRLAVLGSIAGSITSVDAHSVADKEPVIMPGDMARYIGSLPSQKDPVGIGIDKTVVTFQHQHGYCYFSQLTGKVDDVGKFDKIIGLRSGAVLATAGILVRGVQSVLVMGDEDEGDKGRVTGGKGVIKLMTYTPERGAARDEVIVAGDFSGEAWYNLRTLLSFLRCIPAEAEIRISRAVKDRWAALVTEYDQTIHWIVNSESPYDTGKEPESEAKAVSKNRR